MAYPNFAPFGAPKFLCLLTILLFQGIVAAQPGSLDLNFDGDGKLIHPFSTTDVAYKVAVQENDQKIVVGGLQNHSSQNFNFMIARLNPNGTFDTSFGNGGVGTTD